MNFGHNATNKENLLKLLDEMMYDTKTPVYKSPYLYGNKSDETGRTKEIKMSFGPSWRVIDEKFFNEDDPKGTKYSRSTRDELINQYNERKNSDFNKTGPFSFEDAKKPRQFPKSEAVEFTLIPKELYNRVITIDDYDIIFQHVYIVSDDDDKDFQENKKAYDAGRGSSYYRRYCHYYEQWNVIMRHHGYHKMLAKVRITDTVEYDYSFPKGYKNWFKENLTEKNNCMMREESRESKYEIFYENLEHFMKLLDPKTESRESDIVMLNWFEWTMTEEEKKKVVPIPKLNAAIDFSWFIQKETKNGVYKPSRAVIDSIYFTSYEVKKEDFRNLKKDVLKQLDVHTIQLSDSAHFHIESWYDIKGIAIKGPKKVIERYGYEKYCASKEIVEKIKAEKAEAKRKQDLAVHNNTFTLMQHGRVVLKDKQSEEILAYLENLDANDMEVALLENMKPIFDAFPEVKRFNVCSFGTYYAYELAGESHFDDNPSNEHINANTLRKINELYEECFYIPSEETLRRKYGWPERGAEMLYVKRKGNKLVLETEDRGNFQ